MPDTSAPEDFDNYWQGVCRELETVPIAPEEEHLPIRSTEFCDCYTVRFTGIGPYRLFGYLSIPHGDGPFPTLLLGPGYHSVVEPLPQGDANEKRGRFLIFSTAGRGQRNADKPFAAMFPGLMTEGIDAPETYIFRGIVADWLRAVDYLLTRPEVDRSRLALVKQDGLPLLTAALRPEVTHVVASPGSFYGARQHPPEEVADYLRLFPEKRPQVERTLSYFDPLFCAPKVHAQTLIWGNPNAIAPLTEAIGSECQVKESEHSSYKDGLYQEGWISQQFGFTDTIVPAHWQS
ncbi:MAG: acetylxylan esterase [Candidatus Poribacteria bacterium]|nr:acetylxylan esterase [Candidatus Poribacteria bacterium]